MPEQEKLKVYELAKELGIDSISLLDQLKTINIHVKTHMSELRLEEVHAARLALTKKKAESSKKTTSKPQKTGKKTKDTASHPAIEAETQEKKVTTPVIRRRIKTENHEVEQASSTPVVHHTEVTTEEVSPSATHLSASLDQASETQEASEPLESSSAHAPIVETPVNAPTTMATPTKPPIFLTPRPVAPRRSILKIVEPVALPQRPMIKPQASPLDSTKAVVKGTTTNQDKEGYRIIKMTKENLDQMVEEEAAKKRGGVREQELRPEDIRFADYRKKELVFLPKKKKIPIDKKVKQTQKTVAKAKKRIIDFSESITVQDLSSQLSVKTSDVIKKLIALGQATPTIHQSLDLDTATLIAHEYQYDIRNITFQEETLLQSENQKDKPEQLEPRPPVVTIMGHVDHGKTTLLDAIRETNVAKGEKGGITQHIGAYTIEKNKKWITFIDTPGHEAFTTMRARGAHATDIVVIVVSADDGVMPQTREAISHAQAAKAPIIVAINKMDKPGANPEKVKQALAELNLLSEDWGGETVFVPVSALKKTNLEQLLDAILLQAEIMDLKANINTKASGTVLESRLEKGRGPVVSVLVNRGTLHLGDPLVVGQYSGKVKALTNDKGQPVKTAAPGFAVEILGLEGVPQAGETFYTLDSEAYAKKVIEHRNEKTRQKAVESSAVKSSLEQLFSKIQSGHIKELNLILKTDTYGSVEAIRDSLLKLSNEKVKINIILAAPGGITESDVLLARASSSIILGFNVRPETKARQMAEASHVEIQTYGIIYELIDEVKKSMTGLLDKKKIEKFLGRAEVRQVFIIPKMGSIAGTSVIDGKILRNSHVRLLRDSRIICEGKLSSLKRFKDDVKEVASGFECGMGIENYNDLKPGDIIEAFQVEWVAPELDHAN